MNRIQLLSLAVIAVFALVESLAAGLRRGPRFSRALALFPLHFSPLILGTLLLELGPDAQQPWRILLLLLLLSLILRSSWHIALRLGAAGFGPLRLVLAACALLVALGLFAPLPIWLVSGALALGLLSIAIYNHAVIAGRLVVGRPNLRLLAAALGFIALLDAGLARSPWRWDLHLFGPGPGFSSDAALRQSKGKPFLPARDVERRDVALKPGHGLRVLLIGGSSAAGCCAPEGGTMQAVLQAGLRERGLAAEVLNGAWDGYVSHYMVLDAVEGYRKLRPDLLLMYLGANDNGLIDTLGDKFLDHRRPQFIEWLRRRPSYQLLGALLQRPRRAWRRPEPLPAVSQAVFAENLAALRELYGENGAASLLFIEAWQTERPESYERNVLHAARLAGLDAVNTDLILRQTYTSLDDFMKDDVHPNALGHWSVGMIMLGELQARGLLPACQR